MAPRTFRRRLTPRAVLQELARPYFSGGLYSAPPTTALYSQRVRNLGEHVARSEYSVEERALFIARIVGWAQDCF